MKAEIDGKNQLRIIAESTYESLALNAWYDTFFDHYNSKEPAWILNMSKPKANDLESPALLIELHGDDAPAEKFDMADDAKYLSDKKVHQSVD